MALKERTVELDEGQAGSDLAGPNPEHMHEDFIATVYPDVHENLKLTTEEQVHIENPPSSSGTLSSMKNLEDAFTFGDQFLNEKSMEEEPRKANVETKVESMVIVPIHQASSSVPPLSTPIIDLSPPKLGLEVGSIRRIQGIGYGVLEFLGVGTTFDIFQNIHILYLQYGVLTSSGYDVLSFTPLWSLVNARTDTSYLL
ncbi:hypothetical protein Tco_0097796 [Tanacetum coccineum]